MATFRMVRGKYQAVVRIKGHRPSYKVFETLREAKRWATETEALLRGNHIEETAENSKRRLSKITLKQVCEQYAEFKAPFSEKTFYGLKWLTEDKLSEKTLDQLTVDDALGLKKRYLEKASTYTAALRMRTAKNVWNYAKRLHNLKGDNPFEGVMTVKSTKRWVRFTPADQDKFMEHCDCVFMQDFVAFAIETAMRRGEIAAITASDILGEGEYVYIPKTKTNKPRKIPLTKQAQEIVKRRRQKGEKLFADLNPRTISRKFNTICAKAGLKDKHLHDLRHEGLTRLNNKGLTTTDLLRISGHTSLACLAIYVNSEVAEVASKMWGTS